MDKDKVLNDISLAMETIDNRLNIYGMDTNFVNIYSFSNENLAGYLRENNYQDKMALTVGSSADQILNLINYNCQDITLVDINPFVKYYYELKKAAIFGLNRDEFLDFFCNKMRTKILSTGPFEKRIYKKIAGYLSEESQMFWEKLLQKYHTRILKQYLFIPGELLRDSLILNNDYLLQDNFNVLRKKINNVKIEFVQANILNYDFGLEQYDYILLSNVFDYLFNITVTNSRLGYVIPPTTQIKYLEFVKRIITSLKIDGKFLFNYRWDIAGSNLISYRAVDRLFADKDLFTQITFEGSNRLCDEVDSIYMYTKKR